jgi:nucleotidyltransferase/DNA polymerase involved in DNA repair
MFATIYLPNFHLQAAMRHQPELRAKPVALIETHKRKVAIMQLNETAEKAGVRKGMTPSQGLAQCLSLIIKTRAHAQEKLMNEILLQHAFILSPFVEITATGVCTIQFTDNRNLSVKVSRIIEQLAECDIIAQAGIASAPATSLLVANLANPVLEIEDAREFLAPLPIETLALA